MLQWQQIQVCRLGASGHGVHGSSHACGSHTLCSPRVCLLQLKEAQHSVHRLVRGLDCFSGKGMGCRTRASQCQQRLGVLKWSAAADLPCLAACMPMLRHNAAPSQSRICTPHRAEGILLCDVGAGWEVRYVNSAFSRLTNVAREHAVGAAFWSLFGLPAGGATPADVQAAVRRRQPFTLACGLLASSAHSEAAELGQLSPIGSMDVEPPTSPSGSQGTPCEAAALFSVTLTPASAPEFRPDEPAIAIPMIPPPGLPSNSSGGGGGRAAEERLWFCTLQRPVARQASGRTSPGSAGTTHGSLTSGSGPPSPISHLRPLNMAGVQLGPLLGVGASGRWAPRG